MCLLVLAVVSASEKDLDVGCPLAAYRLLEFRPRLVSADYRPLVARLELPYGRTRTGTRQVRSRCADGGFGRGCRRIMEGRREGGRVRTLNKRKPLATQRGTRPGGGPQGRHAGVHVTDLVMVLMRRAVST